MHDPDMTIPDLLGAALDANNLTQEEAAARLGVKQPTVNRWLSGKDTPADKHVPALVELTGLPQDQILEALHRQRLSSASMPTRVASLEAEVAALRTTLDEVLALVRELPR
jgi:transcriptional regulator with XRE-family HTH domain